MPQKFPTPGSIMSGVRSSLSNLLSPVRELARQTAHPTYPATNIGEAVPQVLQIITSPKDYNLQPSRPLDPITKFPFLKKENRDFFINLLAETDIEIMKHPEWDTGNFLGNVQKVFQNKYYRPTYGYKPGKGEGPKTPVGPVSDFTNYRNMFHEGFSQNYLENTVNELNKPALVETTPPSAKMQRAWEPAERGKGATDLANILSLLYAQELVTNAPNNILSGLVNAADVGLRYIRDQNNPKQLDPYVVEESKTQLAKGALGTLFAATGGGANPVNAFIGSQAMPNLQYKYGRMPIKQKEVLSAANQKVIVPENNPENLNSPNPVTRALWNIPHDEEQLMKRISQWLKQPETKQNIIQTLGGIGQKETEAMKFIGEAPSKIAAKVARKLMEDYIYNPQSKKVFPQSMAYPENRPDMTKKQYTPEELSNFMPYMFMATSPVTKGGSIMQAQNAADLARNASPQVVYRAVDSHGGGATLGKGTYFAQTPENAMPYGKDVRPFTIDPKAKMWDLRDPLKLEQITQDAIRADRELFLKLEQTKGANEAVGTVLTKWAKNLGYDGIIGPDDNFGSVVFDSKNLIPVGQAAQSPLYDVTEKAKQIIGTTTRAEEAGYITQDGKMLDFSGRHYASGYKSGKPLSGQPDYLARQRNVDHREIGQIFDEIGAETSGNAMLQFEKAGNIRVSPSSGDLNISLNLDQNITPEQIKTLNNMQKQLGGKIYYDIYKVGGEGTPLATGTTNSINTVINKFKSLSPPLSQSTGATLDIEKLNASALKSAKKTISSLEHTGQVEQAAVMRKAWGLPTMQEEFSQSTGGNKFIKNILKLKK